MIEALLQIKEEEATHTKDSIITGHSISTTTAIETAIFLESAETIETAESACAPVVVTDDSLGGTLPGTKSIGCDHKPTSNDAAKGHVRLAKGGLKSDFTFSVNSHNHSINVAIQQILNKLTPQEMVNVESCTVLA